MIIGQNPDHATVIHGQELKRDYCSCSLVRGIKLICPIRLWAFVNICEFMNMEHSALLNV